jgi:hypothetical protein
MPLSKAATHHRTQKPTGRRTMARGPDSPKKPGRPSHSYHTYLMAGLRLVVGAEVKAGDAHSGSHSLPGLLKILDALSLPRRPKLVRGDCGFASDTLMAPLEERQQPYLFKLKLSKNVKRHIERIFWGAGWSDAGQGWEGKDGRLRLSGWQAPRRVVVLRRPLKGEVLIAQDQHGQHWLRFIEADRKTGKRITGYEYAVLVTNTDYEILSLGQLYRDRADAENAFDELKNQWGWGGFTTEAPRIAASSRPAPWRSSTTGGACSCDWPTPRPGARSSPAGRGCSPRWDARPNMPPRPPSRSPDCMPVSATPKQP